MSFTGSGILLIDKPEGPSSAHVVARVKRILGARKVGHLGTLDPFASGLLPLGINEGTKIAQPFLDADKSYTGIMVLGAETDTQDRTGKLLRRGTVPKLDEADLRALCRGFKGCLQQIPPMFSALKRDGVRLYELARKGEIVPRAARTVAVRSLELWQTGREEIGFALTCSKGTYVRTLVADMGEHLGCGAYLHRLRRIGCGPFDVFSAVTLEQLEECAAPGAIPIISTNAALAHLPAIVFEELHVQDVRAGRQEVLAEMPEPHGGAETMRIVDRKDNLVALAVWQTGGRVWRIARVFNG